MNALLFLVQKSNRILELSGAEREAYLQKSAEEQAEIKRKADEEKAALKKKKALLKSLTYDER